MYTCFSLRYRVRVVRSQLNRIKNKHARNGILALASLDSAIKVNRIASCYVTLEALDHTDTC